MGGIGSTAAAASAFASGSALASAWTTLVNVCLGKLGISATIFAIGTLGAPAIIALIIGLFGLILFGAKDNIYKALESLLYTIIKVSKEFIKIFAKIPGVSKIPGIGKSKEDIIEDL